jgi:HK97 gp10 family phage protein
MKWIVNLKTDEASQKVENAVMKAVKDLAIDIAGDVVKGSPVAAIAGGTNRRSINYEVEGLKGSCYSTSGYGGYLEVGTVKMAARPYFRPALDKNSPNFPKFVKRFLGE